MPSSRAAGRAHRSERASRARVRCAGALLALALCTGAAHAQSGDVSALQQALDDARAQIAAQGEQLAAQQRLLDEQRRRIDSIESSLEHGRGDSAPSGPQAGAPPLAPVGSAAAPTVPAVDAETAGAQPLLLTPRGSWVFEPGFQYTYSSGNRVSIVGLSVLPALTVGLIDVEQVSRNTLTDVLGVRYGLTSSLEIEARIPYVESHDSLLSRPLNEPSAEDVASRISGHGQGDVEAALRYQLPWTGRRELGLIGEIRVKGHNGKGPLELVDSVTGQANSLATGTGFWSVQPSLIAVLPIDPAVLYGGVGYQWNVERDYGGDIGHYDPADGIDLNFGIGLALTETSSLSIGYDQLWLGRNRQNGRPVPGALSVQVSRLLFGYSHRLSRSTRMQLSLAAGLTQAAPDFQLSTRLAVSY